MINELEPKNKTESRQIRIATYVYPAWHSSEYRKALGEKWTEWELLKSAQPLFSGHNLSEPPLWGCYDDSKPRTVAKQINAAIAHNINIFIFVYYWKSIPVMNEGIDNGFLKAQNNKKIDFALLLSPRLPRNKLPLPKDLSDASDRKRRDANLNPTNIMKFIKFASTEYFKKSNYLKINNSPVLYFFQYYDFVKRWGGEKNTQKLFKKINKYLRSEGFSGLYPIGTTDYVNETKDLRKTGFKAITSYNLLGSASHGEPVQDYTKAMEKRTKWWPIFAKRSRIAYLPCISLGFDASCRGEPGLPQPRTLEGGRYYPWYPIMENFEIKSFEDTLRKAASFILKQPDSSSILHVASWNEWTEGNHLEPGLYSGYTHLQTIEKIYREINA